MHIQIHQAPGGLGLLESGLQIPAHVGEVMLHQFQLEVQFLFEAAILRAALVQGLVNLAMAADEGSVIGQGRFQGLADSGLGGEVGILGQPRHPQPLGGDHLARVRGFLVGEQLEQGGFARAVAANEADLFALHEAEGEVLQDGLGAVALAHLDQAEGNGHGNS